MATNSLDQDFQSSSCLHQLGNWAGMLIRGWTGVFVVALLFLCRDFVDDDWFLRVSWIFLSKLSDKPAYGYRFFPPSLIDLTLLRQLCMKHILWNILDSEWFHKSTHNLWLEWQNQILQKDIKMFWNFLLPILFQIYLTEDYALRF